MTSDFSHQLQELVQSTFVIDSPVALALSNRVEEEALKLATPRCAFCNRLATICFQQCESIEYCTPDRLASDFRNYGILCHQFKAICNSFQSRSSFVDPNALAQNFNGLCHSKMTSEFSNQLQKLVQSTFMIDLPVALAFSRRVEEEALKLATPRCAFCNRLATISCRQCESIEYCSADCQASDLEIHGPLCHQFKAIMARKPTDYRAVLLITFWPWSEPRLEWAIDPSTPSDENKKPTPRMPILPISMATLSDGNMVSSPLMPILKPSRGKFQFTRHTVEGTNPIRQRPYRRPLRLWRIQDPDDQEINRSVGSIMPPTVPNTWPGSAIAMLAAPDEGQIDLRDLRELADFFASQAANDNQLLTLRDNLRMVKGVRINCPDEMNEYEVEQFMPVGVSNAHPIHLDPAFCDISRLVGMPIKMYQYEAREDQPAGENPAASILHRSADVNSKTWGFPSQRWSSAVGNVVVVRCDGKDLLPEHVEALCIFCRDYFEDIFSLEAEVNAYRAGNQDARIWAFWKRASPFAFRMFYHLLRDGMGWDDIPAPHEI